jgi:carbonic anhydrase/acetyltransferase-like protein (isoleucine patch superfamily)
LRLVWAVCMIVLPSRLKRHVGRLLLGWDIDPTAYIGRSVILVRHLSMGPGSSIGPLNVIRHLDELRLGEGASIATRNWITGWPMSSEAYTHSPNRRPSLIMGKYAMITVAHDIDCSDRVELGDYASLAGYRCTILTHSLNLVLDRFVTGPVELGSRSAVMSGCTLLSGTRVPNRSIVSADSVVTTPLTQELTLYRGNPAEAIRSLPESLRFFHRGELGADAPGLDADHL